MFSRVEALNKGQINKLEIQFLFIELALSASQTKFLNIRTEKKIH